ncbi:MAG TPA: hypothetical protein VJS88_03750, partial [Chthoniobacterales bacterium]|nr:hypothetical protein [Chthoniobacterales bacterium]
RPRRCAAILFLFAGFVGGCSFFSTPPPLPRRAAIEPASTDEKFTAMIEGADIIYFPRESVAPRQRSNAAWRLVDALNRSGNPFALGWDAENSTDLHRVLALEAERLDAEILELRPPAPITSGEIDENFSMPPEDYERFARRPEFRATSEAKVRSAYETESLALRFVAAKIARYAREHGNGKIVAFLRSERLAESYGVPYLVSQKTKARQLVLNPRVPARPGPGLMARSRSGPRFGSGRLQIVDCAPVAGTNQR